MSDDRQAGEPAAMRKGVPVYLANPSVPEKGIPTRRRPSSQTAGHTRTQAMLLNPDSGEVLGQASVAFTETLEVDPKQFVKVYMDGIRKAVGMSRAGLTVFEWVYEQVQANPGDDRVFLSALEAKARGIAERTFQRGVRDLLDKSFLYASPSPGVYWLNIQYMFNGDRVHFVRTYQLRQRASKATKTHKPALGEETRAEAG